MQEIKCPKCGEVFQVDESGYAAIVKQVRDKEFEKEISARETQFLAEKNSAVKLAQIEVEKQLNEKINQKDLQISELQAKISAETDAKKLAVTEISTEKDKEIEKLKAQINSCEKDMELAVNKVAGEKDKELAEKDKHIVKLSAQIETSEKENQLKEQALKDQYEEKLRFKDEEIAHYKDFKARLSTKMVGESLEQHCEIEFNRIRPTGFQNAYFEKDNDAKTGSKGDYIYKETDENGVEFISIMFEMKNEMDSTSTKKNIYRSDTATATSSTTTSRKTAVKRIANMRFWCLYLSQTANITTRESLMYLINSQKCTSFVRNFSSL